MASAAGTLERQVEVVDEKVETPVATVESAAANESRARVEGEGFTNEARAWNARAQID
jgi:hypothetical protein